jgi:intracellular septation protein
MKTSSAPYFLLSFIPAAAYWLLETYTSLEIALIGGIVLGLIEMIAEKYFTGHVHTLSKLNISLVVGLGVISLAAREGVWFKLQPTLTGLAIGGYLLFQKLRGHSLMLDMLSDMKQKAPLPPEAYRVMEWHMCVFLFAFAVWMAHVAVNTSTANWLFWKTGGFYIAFGGFMIGEMLFLKWYLRRGPK